MFDWLPEFVHRYWEILSDPAHLAVEVTLMLIVDVLVLGLVFPWIKRRVTRSVVKTVTEAVAAEHKILDAEHGVTHTVSDDTVELPFVRVI